jgi:hypothetical protein
MYKRYHVLASNLASVTGEHRKTRARTLKADRTLQQLMRNLRTLWMPKSRSACGQGGNSQLELCSRMQDRTSATGSNIAPQRLTERRLHYARLAVQSKRAAVPAVFIAGDDPVESRRVQSLARPGGLPAIAAAARGRPDPVMDCAPMNTAVAGVCGIAQILPIGEGRMRARSVARCRVPPATNCTDNLSPELVSCSAHPARVEKRRRPTPEHQRRIK